MGVNWAEFSKGNGTVPAGSFVSPVGGSSIVDLAGNVNAIANAGAAGTTSNPSGFDSPDASLAMNLLGPTPTEQVTR